ncbi:hypothetical protein [Saccharococcus thermophilus]|jgi:hypothetical protein|nr:hypothetical protein [Saccharococcus thermophilus]
MLKKVIVSVLSVVVLGALVLIGHDQETKEVAKDQFPPPTVIVE